jgi:L-fuconate dehydratase
MARIVAVDIVDVRFPTSDSLDGSDAMHPDPDYSAAYVMLRTDARDADEPGGQGHGLTFTIGRGTEVVCAAVQALVPMVVGIDVDDLMSNLGRFARMLGGDSQLRWIGPEKGAIHLATAALVNAAWDLRAKREAKPLWRVLADLSPEALVDLVDFTYLTDMVTPAAAVALLRMQEPHRAERIAELERVGYPAYTTSAGWLGYDDDKIRTLCREAIADGFNAIKMKVGADLDDDIRRAALLRGELGPDRLLMTDANQRWDVGQAIEWMRALADQDPYWIEEPTSPDDVLGHAAIARALAPMKVATGEHAHNRVMFKQLLQADAIGVCQVDSCRLGGVNEVLAVLLMAAVAGVPVCPHAGGVGLCEYVSHLAPFDYIAVSGSLDGRMCEWADHLHDHFADPVAVRGGRYVLPSAPGYGTTMRPESLERFRYPDGPVWQARADQPRVKP